MQSRGRFMDVAISTGRRGKTFTDLVSCLRDQRLSGS